MKVEFVRELETPVSGGSRALVNQNGEYFVVSSVPEAWDTGKPETLIFRADEEGHITDWAEVAGGTNYSREQAIEMLEERGPVEYGGDIRGSAIVDMAKGLIR